MTFISCVHRWVTGVSLSVVILLSTLTTPIMAASPITPVAALVFVDETGVMVLHVDLGDARSMHETWRAPAPLRLRALDASPLPGLVQSLQRPAVRDEYLLLNGEPTPQPQPTSTPYVPRSAIPFMLGDVNADAVDVHIPADSSSTGHRFVEVTCVECPSDWAQQVLSQLPDAAPIVVVAPFVAQMDGAWRISATAVTTEGRIDQMADARATLFERLASQPIGNVEMTAQREMRDSPRVEYDYIDGRSRLLRVVICLVAVLFLSVSSFYLSIAVMRRMHAAVGYNPNDGK